MIYQKPKLELIFYKILIKIKLKKQKKLITLFYRPYCDLDDYNYTEIISDSSD